MRRRTLLSLLAAAGWPTGASPWCAQAQRVTPHRIAFVHSGLPAAQLTEISETLWVRHFFSDLRALGYTDGVNLTVERYSAEGHPERFADLAAEVAKHRPELILANQNPLVKALREAAGLIPIVAIVSDPVGFGLVESLAHPGGTITGVSVDAGIEISGKRIQLLKEALPAARTIAYLGFRSDWQGEGGKAMREAGRDLELSVVSLAPSEVTRASLREALVEARRQPIDGLVVSGAGDFLAHRQLIVELVGQARLGAMYSYRDFVDAGGLMAYGPELGDLARRLAQDVHQILTGTKAADIPVYQAAKFELVINLKTAKALGLTVPPSLVARADEVIE